MMYCNHCGAQIPDGLSQCPKCAAKLPKPKPERLKPVRPAREKKPVDEATRRQRVKLYLSILTCLTVFPAVLCIVINLFTGTEVLWSAYAAGGCVLGWVLLALPVFKKPGAVARVAIGGVAVMLYLLMAAALNNNFNWYVKYMLPIVILFTVLTAAIALLTVQKVLKRFHIASAVFAEIGVFLIGIDLIIHWNAGAGFGISWSWITTAVFVGLIVLTECASLIYNQIRKGSPEEEAIPDTPADEIKTDESP